MKHYTHEGSAYWEWVNQHCEEKEEPIGANMDRISENEVQLELSKQLTSRQKRAYQLRLNRFIQRKKYLKLLSIREALVFEHVFFQHRSLRNSASLLGVSHSTCKRTLEQVISKVKSYFRL